MSSLMVVLQVAYRGENASIPIQITNAALRLPAAVGYSIVSLSDGRHPTYIPKNLTAGFLEWDVDSGSELSLDLPIRWSNVTLETEASAPLSQVKQHHALLLTDQYCLHLCPAQDQRACLTRSMLSTE